jgi:hypothetical protein
VVAGARDRGGGLRFIIATLEGHLEAGQEWFLLAKDPATGEVRFRIQARWRPGQLPTWWSYLGFHLFAPRRQRAWHRLAHLRLRRMLAARSAEEEEEARVSWPPLRQLERRTLRADLGIDLEQERVRRERLPLVAGLAAASGALAAPLGCSSARSPGAAAAAAAPSRAARPPRASRPWPRSRWRARGRPDALRRRGFRRSPLRGRATSGALVGLLRGAGRGGRWGRAVGTPRARGERRLAALRGR